MSHAQTRDTLSRDLLDKTHAILGDAPADRGKLAAIETAVSDLAARTELWGEDDFSSPDPSDQQNRFLIAQDAERGYSLYLNVMRPGKTIKPHDHTTWACISAVEGAEINTLFDRTDDGSEPGKASVEVREVVELKPGNALSMMGNDIHSVEIRGTDVIRHLHFYGRPLESLTGRTMYDPQAGTCHVMGIGVKTK